MARILVSAIFITALAILFRGLYLGDAPNAPGLTAGQADSTTIDTNNTSDIDSHNFASEPDVSILTLAADNQPDFLRGARHLVENLEVDQARESLLKSAYDGLRNNDRERLASSLVLLGQMSLQNRDLNGADLYLQEALEIYKNINNKEGEAWVYIQLGKMHIASRQLARMAGRAYDQLLLARYQISDFQYQEAEKNLNTVINLSLRVDRYGTASEAYESLAFLQYERGQIQASERSMVEAAKLYASSGRELKARSILETLEQRGADPYNLAQAGRYIDEQLLRFDREVGQIQAAENYRILFNQLRATGSEVEAWQYRLQASELMRMTSRQVMYHRQPGVIAVLYNSNNDMDSARRFVEKAESLFVESGPQDWQIQSDDLRAQIY